MNKKALLTTLASRLNYSVISIILLIAGIWFVLPLVHFHHDYPFKNQSTRIFLMVLVVLAFACKYLFAFFKQHQEKALPIIFEKLKNIRTNFIAGCHEIVRLSKNGRQEFKQHLANNGKNCRLRKQPWYLIFGTENAGKKTVIHNAGIDFARPDYFGQEATQYLEQFPDFNWWFSEKTVIVNPTLIDSEQEKPQWKKFLKLLQRERKNKPINGVILTISLADLLTYTNQQRQETIQQLCQYIRELHAHFKSQVPVYLLFNKCDLIEGFMEFFNDLSKEELQQIWGMTLPLNECNDLTRVQAFFNNEYNALVNQLRKRVLWALETERSERGRELIHSFPQQMQLFKRPIENFIIELFSIVRYPKALQLRGIYFTSCTQESSQPHDFLLQAMSKKFQLVQPEFERPQRLGECYFMRNLFHQVILPEAPYLGESERSKRLRHLTYQSIRLACPTLIVGLGIGMYSAYSLNLKNLVAVDQSITYYHAALTNMKSDSDSLLGVLPALEPLNDANTLYTQKSGFTRHFLYESGVIQQAIYAALQRNLHAYFLPRIAAQIESNLNQNIRNLNLLYATLKGYLAFSANNNTKASAIKAPMEIQWDKNYLNQPETNHQLKYFLNLALQQDVQKLPLDEQLIDRTRSQLEKIIPSNRAYGLLSLRASVSNIGSLLLSTAAGENFAKIFTVDQNIKPIPALYTHTGFKKIFLPQYAAIAREVAEDNQDIGLANDSDETQSADQINLIIQNTYNQHYIQDWDNHLAGIHVKPFSSLDDAINALTILTSKQSPLSKLFNIVYDNTNGISHDHVQVTGHFEGMNNYAKNDADAVTWQQTAKTLTQIRAYFIKMQQSANQNLAAFDAAKAAMQGSINSPIQALSLEAEKAPPHVKQWLQELANNCWQLIIRDAHKQLNDAWANTVMNEYTSNIENRYPINVDSDSQVAIDSFNRFFGTNGTLSAYFNRYLKPFINTNNKSWALYVVNGHSLEIPKANVALFERLQRIQNDFFPNHAKSASFKFTITPETLDNKASSIQLSIGNQTINYSHGPQIASQIRWPLPFNAEQASLTLNAFGNDQYSRSATGPWALFKIFHYGVLQAAANNGTYDFNLNLSNYTAQFKIIGTSDINTFNLTDLKGFILPSAIATTVVKPATTATTKPSEHHSGFLGDIF